MELDRYRAFLCAVETGSLSAAAERLKYTPSGISRMIATLEEENGFPLLFRDRYGVSLTPEGRQLMPAIRQLLSAGESCRQISEGIRGLETGTVTVGTAYSTFYSPLSAVISGFHREHPGIRIQLCSGFSSELSDKLNAHQLDLCIISRREGAHDWFPVLEDEMMAWVPKEHPLAKLPAVPVAAFENEPYIETYPDQDIDNARVFAECGVTPRLEFSTVDSFATYSMVEAGLGIGMNNRINGLQWNGKVRQLPLEPAQKVEIGIAAMPNMSPVVKAFFEAMLNAFLTDRS